MPALIKLETCRRGGRDGWRGAGNTGTGRKLRTHESLRLLHEVLDAAVSLLEDDDAVLGRLSDLRNNDRALLPVAAVEFEQLPQRVGACHVRGEDDERLAVIQVLPCERQRASYTHERGGARGGGGVVIHTSFVDSHAHPCRAAPSRAR